MVGQQPSHREGTRATRRNSALQCRVTFGSPPRDLRSNTANGSTEVKAPYSHEGRPIQVTRETRYLVRETLRRWLARCDQAGPP
jgi:hypothetical protein